MRQHGIIHPDMLARIQPNFYPSLCTIQASGEEMRDSVGQLIPDPVDVDGLTDIPCRIAPRSTREVRSETQSYVEATHHVALSGYFPTIDETNLAVVDNVTYQIEGVEWDGNQKTTRLYVRLIDG